jgi:hypothetical protein
VESFFAYLGTIKRLPHSWTRERAICAGHGFVHLKLLSSSLSARTHATRAIDGIRTDQQQLRYPRAAVVASEGAARWRTNAAVVDRDSDCLLRLGKWGTQTNTGSSNHMREPSMR